MKGMITGIKRMAIHDGDGVRSTVFFKGCPLKCNWCHNPENISFEKEIAFYQRKCIGCRSCEKDGPQACPTGAKVYYGEEWTVEALTDELLQDRDFFESSGGGVTLSGGECLAQAEFAIALAKHLYERGISVDIDTCGFVSPQVLKDIIPYTDTFLYDIKAIDPKVHRKCTGQDNTLILENLKYLAEAGCKIEIRYPFVPGYNDEECHKIGQFLKEITHITKVKVLGYHGYADAKYRALGMPDTLPKVTVTAEEVDVAVDILREYGLNAVNGMRED